MKLITWARYAYLAGIVATLLLFVPFAWFPLIVGKVAAAAVLFVVAGVLWGVAAWREHHPIPSAAWLFALLPLSYLVSWFFSADQAVGIVGTGIDTDTLLFTTLCAAAGMLGSALFRSGHAARQLLQTVLWSAVAAVAFQFVVLLGLVPGMTDRTTNLIGKWNDFGALVVLLLTLILVELQWGSMSRRMRLGAWVAGAVSLVLLALVNFTTAWTILLFAAGAVALIAWARTRALPRVPAAVALIALVFLFFGAAINTQLSTIVPVTSLEVRPAFQATVDVITATHGSSVRNTAIGMGPNTFGLMWLAHKPLSVNQSQFWNLDFNVGFSTLATAFGAVGLLGALMWLVPLMLVVYLLWRTRAQSERMLSFALGGGAVLLWSVIVLYVPSPDLILLAMALAGAAVGLMAGANRFDTRTASRGALVVVVLALLWTGWAAGKRYVAEAYLGQAAAALQAADVAGAQAAVTRSISVEAMPENLRAAVAVGGTKLQQLASAPASSDTQQQFADTLKSTIAYGQQAIALDPIDYRSYVSIGQIYDLLAANKVTGAYDQAKAAYQAAETYNPLNPEVPLLLAELEARSGTVQGLQDALKQSLTLKPDYTDAILFLAQIDIARNDLASAINDTKVAAQTAPGVASIWLQLGLLYYAGGDSKDAIPALEQALAVQPDYANAQYYLGLAYYAQGRQQDSLSQFERLAETNPDNTDVKTILGNLLAGKPPIATTTASTSKSKKK